MTRLAGVVAAIVLMTAGTLAHAAPPADATSEFSPWFNDLRDGDGKSCCSIADCRRTEYRFSRVGLQAMTPSGEWVAIPTETILPRTDNPTGFGILCWNGTRVLCFVRAAEG